MMSWRHGRKNADGSSENKNNILLLKTGNRSLTDRTQDSDSCNVGSIPAGCIFYVDDSFLLF